MPYSMTLEQQQMADAGLLNSVSRHCARELTLYIGNPVAYGQLWEPSITVPLLLGPRFTLRSYA